MVENLIETPVQKLARQMDKPSLAALSYALRHPETWPKDFEWDYGYCETCAIGLTVKLWFAGHRGGVDGTTLMAREFAMPWEAARRIFVQAYRPRNLLDVRNLFSRSPHVNSPERVADLIDDYLKRDASAR